MPLWSPSSSVEDIILDPNNNNNTNSVSSSSWDSTSSDDDDDDDNNNNDDISRRNRLETINNNNNDNPTDDGTSTTLPTPCSNNNKIIASSSSHNLLVNNKNQTVLTPTDDTIPNNNNNATFNNDVRSNSTNVQRNSYQNYYDDYDDDDYTSDDSDSFDNSKEQQQKQQPKNWTSPDDNETTTTSSSPPPLSQEVPNNNVVLPSIEKERQLLILVLLAQVCALHDPTPRTFTIHVLELYERGILDPESIHFLYDLGLVPNTNTTPSPTANTTTTTTTTTTAISSPTKASSYTDTETKKAQAIPNNNEKRSRKQTSNGQQTYTVTNNNPKKVITSNDENGITVVVNSNNNNTIENKKDFLRKRSLEASAIRTKLVEQEEDSKNVIASSTDHTVMLESQRKQQPNNYHHIGIESDNEPNNNTKTNSAPAQSKDDEVISDDPGISAPKVSSTASTSWSVKEHQLSLSRYQREFHQVCMLSSGSFGQVYKAINIMDQREYAIKRIQFNAEGYDRDTLQITTREVHCLAICDHPNVVRYYTSWLEPSWMTGATTVSAHSNHLRALTNSSENTISESNVDEDDYDNDNNEFNNSSAVTNLVAAATRGGGKNRSDSISEELKAYFKDPFLSDSNGSSYQRNDTKKSQNHSIWSNESTSATSWRRRVEQDDDVSEWTVRNNNNQRGRYDSWKYHSSRDDIFFEDSAAQQRRSSVNISLQHQTSRDDSTIFDRTTRDIENEASNQYNQGGQMIVHRQQKVKPPQKKVENQNVPKSYKYQICLFIQMQLCHPATLADWIRERNNTASTKSTTQERYTVDDRIHIAGQIFHQIASGLHHVHKKGIVHRDLKPANIFASTDDGLQFKIGDFGLSKLIASPVSSSGSPRLYTDDVYYQGNAHHNNKSTVARDLMLTNSWEKPWGRSNVYQSKWEDPLTSGVGTASYAAPEQVETTTYGSEADIFSLGLILLELLCCFSTEHERLQTFYDCRYRRKIPEDLKKYPIAYQTILSCTEPKAANRPIASELEKLVISSLHDTRQECNSVYPTVPSRLLLMNEPYITSVSTAPAVEMNENDENNDCDEISKLRAELETLRGQVQNCLKLIEEKDQTIAVLREELSIARSE